MKCPTYKCKAGCCYNVPFPPGFLEAHKDAVVTEIKAITHPYGNDKEMPITHPYWEDNKCPFLRSDYKCNIYADRPEVCRKMAEIPQMPCPFLNQIKL